MSIIETKIIRTQTTKRIELSESDLRELVRAHSGEVPASAAIFVEVPGGGDWSNTQLDISESPIIITWSEVTEEQS